MVMINIVFPAQLVVFTGYCIEAAQLDLFQGPLVYKQIFNFRPTSAYNSIFELFGMED